MNDANMIEPKRQRAIAAAMNIDGWLTPREAGALYDLAYSANGPIVEIGSHKGRSTAALALGSMDGSRQMVYAIDSFIGVPPSRETDLGGTEGWNASGPELVKENLAIAGVDGSLVRIIPHSSQAAVDMIPDCAVLFVDGAHDLESVSRDFDLYLPKVMPGGSVMVHDCTPDDPDVPLAVDQKIMSCCVPWEKCGRVDSAVIFRNSVPQGYQVALALPGGKFEFGSICAVAQASLGVHTIKLDNNSNGFDDYNAMWVRALNRFERGEITHFAMLHSDVIPCRGWLDLLIGEMECHKADLVSAIIPIKDHRGVSSSGVGDMNDRWHPLRRFTMREVFNMPKTFSIEQTPHTENFLLHNTGCWVCDLRNPLFRQTDADSNLLCFFDFPTACRRDENRQWVNLRESEDWFFSRALHGLGAKTFCTRAVELIHRGSMDFQNNESWGHYQNGDEDSRAKWSGSVMDTERELQTAT